MRRVVFIILLLFSTGAVYAQGNVPQVTSFTSSVNSVDRSSLRDGSARVPVNWEAINRPLTANLVFEQVLPDGRVVNVELPRPFPWVNSSGSGIAAPVDPGDDQNTVLLRVRMVNIFTQVTLAQRELRLDVVSYTPQPQIATFNAGVTRVNRADLVAGTARIPVSWHAVNRRLTTNLVFEQILPDGRVVNVELPRANIWVNSTGDGVTAPIDPGSDTGQINLRVRLYSFVSGQTLDTETLTLAINEDAASNDPQIAIFSTNADQVSAVGLHNRSERVNVTWSVLNRPANSNLYFEQMLEDGQTPNVELPRNDPYVSSTGSGAVSPMRPNNEATTTIILRVVLRDIFTGSVYDEAQITLPIVGTYPDIRVNSFTVTPTSATGGDMLTVSWDVTGVDTVSLMMSHYGLRFGWTPVHPGQPALGRTGTFTVPAPDGVRQVDFILTADTLTQTITIPLTCRIAWFSESDFHCPDAEPQSIQAAYQPFENGYMIWRQDTSAIWVYLNAFDNFTVYGDTYTGGEIVFDETPPEGHVQPINGFGKLWVENEWLRDQLGWALSAEQGYTMTYQQSPWGVGTRGSLFRMFTLPSGAIISANIGEF